MCDTFTTRANDDSKVDKDALSENPLVKGQFKADHQYQIVIGPGTVDEVYKQFVEETGVEASSKDDAKNAAAQKGNPLQRLIKLLETFLFQYYRLLLQLVCLWELIIFSP